MDRRIWVVLACAVAACNLKREPPHTTPTGNSSAGVGGDWPFSSTTSVLPSTGPGPQPDHCYCIYATAHVDACANCALAVNGSKCDTEWQACEADPTCKALVDYCISAVENDGGMIDTCFGQPGKTRDLLEAYYGCVCTVVACTNECEGTKQCGAMGQGGASASSSASSASSAASTSVSTSVASTSAATTSGSGGGSSSSTGP